MRLYWKDSYSVGIEQFDEQHKKLFRILNELFEAQKGGIASGIIKDKLDELSEYTHYHFETEEKVLEENGYENLDEQKREHKYFKDHLQDLQKGAGSGSLLLTVKVLDFLREWIIAHILGTDMEYSSFLKNKSN